MSFYGGVNSGWLEKGIIYGICKSLQFGVMPNV